MDVNRRTAIKTAACAGVGALAGWALVEPLGTDATAEQGRDKVLPSLFDCNAWIGETDVDPISSRLYRPATGGVDLPADMLAEMDRVGIDRALVYHVTARTENAKAGNERLLRTVADYPRFEPCWVVTPDALDEYGSATAFADAMDAADVNAVRMFPGEHDYRLTDGRVEPILDALAAADTLLVLDGLSGVVQDGFTYDELGEVCADRVAATADAPGLTVLVTQLYPSMGALLDSDVGAALDRARNLYVGTGRLQTHEGLRQFVDQFGVERLLFGTHLPHASAGAGIATVMLSSLTPAERRQVAGENLARLLGIPQPGGDDSRGIRGVVDRVLGGRPVGGPDRRFEVVPYGVVDLHGHVRYTEPSLDMWPDADGIVEQMDRTGIDLCCVSNLWQGPDGNDVAADAATRYPDRLVPVAYADPNWDDVRGELERAFDDLGIRIIKLHPTSDDTVPDDPAYDPVWEFAEERECLVVTHARCTDAETAAFTEVATTYPEMTVMLYHATRSWVRADNYVSVVDRCPNVVLETTYSYNVDGIIEYLVEQVGPDRVFFGTDMAARAPESQVGWATYARLDERDRRLLMRENGLRLLAELGVLPDAYDAP